MFDEGGDLFIFHAKTRSYMIPRLTEALKGRRISASEVSTLLIVHDHPGCSLKDICLKIASDKGRMTNIVKHLTEEGLVENRSPNKKTYQLYLTEDGMIEHDFSRDALRKINDAMTVNLTDRQKGIFIKLMKKITDVTDLGYEY